MVESYTIKGEGAKEIISHLSEEFKTEWEDNGNDYCFDLPKKFGTGHFRTVQFSHGIHVMEIDIRLKKEIQLQYKKQSINLLRFLYNSISSLEHSTDKSSDTDKIGKLQCSIFSNGIETEHQLNLLKNQAYSIYIICINRKQFEEKINEIIEKIPDELEGFFRDVNGVNNVYHKSFFSLEISKMIEEFRHADLEDLVHTVFFYYITSEILTYQLQNYHDSKNGNKKQVFLRQSTIEKIEQAVEIIKDEIDVGINVHSLAKRVGLNQNTLQSGFKNLFQSSVNSYIQKYRMEFAKQLIEESDLNITEITYKIGINSRSYFSKLFKEQFGVSPSTHLTKYRKEKEVSA